jgi:hypothetical protein
MTLERKTRNNLSMKQGNLSCFVCHTEISQIMVLDALLLVFSQNSPWVGVHSLRLRLQCESYWLSNYFLNENYINKNKLLEFRALLGVVGKTSVTQI